MTAFRKRTRGQNIGLILGVILFLITLTAVEIDPQKETVHRMASVAVLMAVWWLTDAIPLSVTALLPLVFFPLFKIMPGFETAPLYINSTIFLFIGGFIIALAMERWNLHRRIALKIILWLGRSRKALVLGFMAATAFLSMWISNTATTMMMVPIGIAIISKMEESDSDDKGSGDRNLALCLMLGIAYAASIGGIGTLIGTPPNLAFSRIFAISFPGAPEISFSQWFIMATPISVTFLILTWFVLTYLIYPLRGSETIEGTSVKEEYERLGPASYEEKAVFIVFVATALLWLSRQDIVLGSLRIPGWSSILSLEGSVDDGTVAIAMAVLLFIVPSRRSDTGMLMDWKTALKLPWGIVLLFGGGFALAGGMSSSGLSYWIGKKFAVAGDLQPFLIVLLVCLVITFLTEFTSNTATAQMILPILATISISLRLNPLYLMIPATISSSCAFMMPVATPPNAIIFGSGRVKISEMARAGVFLNLLGALLITSAMYLIIMRVFDIHLGKIPHWATFE
ncbi:MAG: SLC13 family permease [Candidatus Glassbacteria bacterium]